MHRHRIWFIEYRSVWPKYFQSSKLLLNDSSWNLSICSSVLCISFCRTWRIGGGQRKFHVFIVCDSFTWIELNRAEKEREKGEKLCYLIYKWGWRLSFAQENSTEIGRRWG